ncbi:hypothetical protein [Herbidospora sp. RD11066]
MFSAFSGWVIGAALLLAVVSLVTAIRNRPMGAVILAGLVLVEVALVVQAVIAFPKAGEVTEQATFVGYLLGTIVIPPAALWWGRAERTRWGPAVIAVGAFTAGVMTGRLLQLWNMA